MESAITMSLPLPSWIDDCCKRCGKNGHDDHRVPNMNFMTVIKGTRRPSEDISMASICYKRRREFERNYLGTEIEAQEVGRGAKLGENETASLVVRRDRGLPGVAFRPLFRDYCICSPNEVNCPKLLSSV